MLREESKEAAPLFICTWILTFFSLKYRVWWTWFFLVWTWCLQTTQAMNIKFAMDQKSISSNSIFQTQYFKNQVQIDKGLIVWPSNMYPSQYYYENTLNQNSNRLGYIICYLRWKNLKQLHLSIHAFTLNWFSYIKSC